MSRRLRRAAHRAIADLADAHRPHLARTLADQANNPEFPELFEQVLGDVIGRLHRRGGRRHPGQLDLVVWMEAQSAPARPTTEPTVEVQLNLFEDGEGVDDEGVGVGRARGELDQPAPTDQ